MRLAFAPIYNRVVTLPEIFLALFACEAVLPNFLLCEAVSLDLVVLNAVLVCQRVARQHSVNLLIKLLTRFLVGACFCILTVLF